MYYDWDTFSFRQVIRGEKPSLTDTVICCGSFTFNHASTNTFFFSWIEQEESLQLLLLQDILQSSHWYATLPPIKMQGGQNWITITRGRVGARARGIVRQLKRWKALPISDEKIPYLLANFLKLGITEICNEKSYQLPPPSILSTPQPPFFPAKLNPVDTPCLSPD